MRTVEKWIEINAPIERVFDLFDKFENFPRWVPGVRSVSRLDQHRALLTTDLRAGSAAPEWDVETTARQPPQGLAWRFMQGGIHYGAEATFEETPRGSTLLRFVLSDDSSARAGFFAGLFGERVGHQLEESLEGLKRIAEQPREQYDEEATILSESLDDDLTLVPSAARQVKVPAHADQTAPALSTPSTEPSANSRPTIEERAKDAVSATKSLPREAESITRLRPPPRPVKKILLYAGLASLLGLVIGAFLWLAIRQREREIPEAQNPQDVVTSSPATNDVREQAATQPAATDDSPPILNEPESSAAQPEAQPEANVNARRMNQAPREPPEGNHQAELRTALDTWTAATNARDIGRQINFYAPVVERYYLRKNFSRAAVRADKARLAERANLIDVSTGEPEIKLDPDGRTATMRFRKQYRVEGGRSKSRGEVVQELKWVKTEDGWKITGERDIRVIR